MFGREMLGRAQIACAGSRLAAQGQGCCCIVLLCTAPGLKAKRRHCADPVDAVPIAMHKFLHM